MKTAAAPLCESEPLRAVGTVLGRWVTTDEPFGLSTSSLWQQTILQTFSSPFTTSIFSEHRKFLIRKLKLATHCQRLLWLLCQKESCISQTAKNTFFPHRLWFTFWMGDELSQHLFIVPNFYTVKNAKIQDKKWSDAEQNLVLVGQLSPHCFGPCCDELWAPCCSHCIPSGPALEAAGNGAWHGHPQTEPYSQLRHRQRAWVIVPPFPGKVRDRWLPKECFFLKLSFWKREELNKSLKCAFISTASFLQLLPSSGACFQLSNTYYL